MAKALGAQRQHLPCVRSVLSPSPQSQGRVEGQHTGQQRHPDGVAAHAQEQLDGVLDVHRPGQDEEVTAEEGQVVTEALRPANGAPRPDLQSDPGRHSWAVPHGGQACGKQAAQRLVAVTTGLANDKSNRIMLSKVAAAASASCDSGSALTRTRVEGCVRKTVSSVMSVPTGDNLGPAC